MASKKSQPQRRKNNPPTKIALKDQRPKYPPAKPICSENPRDTHKFEFSIIMAVYNVESFIREAIDSVINQNIGFEHVQLILVDDGTPDNSGLICEEYRAKYPQNIVVVHKKNGGQASARNEGLKYAEGRYINFMDPDDKLSLNTLSKVSAFFWNHLDETDMVAIPMHFFDGQQGEHWQNTKFNKGDRIIYLRQEYKTQQTSASSTFYNCRVKDLLIFDTVLPNNEDFKINLRVLAEKFTLGVVTDCKYWYRRRSQGPISTVQGITANKKWYFEWFTYLCDWACDYYQNRFGYLPAFLQYSILCDMLWRYQSDNSRAMAAVLTEEERQEHINRLKKALARFEDRYIMELPVLSVALKCLMLTHKYNRHPDLVSASNREVMVQFQNTPVIALNVLSTQIEFISIKDNLLTIEGYTNLIGVKENDFVSISLSFNGNNTCCTIVDRPNLCSHRFGEVVTRSVGFICQRELNPNASRYEIKLICSVREKTFEKKSLECARFSPLSSKLKYSYYYSAPWKVSAVGSTLRVVNCKTKDILRNSERDLRKELWKKNEPGMRKAILVRASYHFAKRFKKNQIWLLSDRVTRAGDNGEVLFRYLREKKPAGITPYFVIDKNSPDYAAMKKVGKVVPYMSYKHKLLHLLADKIVSSAGDLTVTNPFGVPGNCYKDIMAHHSFVFLQHGVTKDDQSNWLGRYNRAIDGLVTSSPAEQKSMIEGEGYYYDESNIWLTGMPRFDRLYRDSKKKITIMPTWRQYLMSEYNAASGKWELSSRFTESDYFKFYSSLLKHPRLIAAARKYGYTLQFYPHPNIMQHIDLFKADPSIEILHENTEYRTVYAETDLIITDYSSAVFDFAYLYQPIIYAQFDAEQFFSGNHVYKKGYFDYERDAFGEVEYDLESAVNRAIEYMQNDCQMKPMYRERVDRFFAFRDQNNCERVFNKIMEMKQK